ncbi:hypothetical protein L9F63_021006, partial [Diploptera punctata]
LCNALESHLPLSLQPLRLNSCPSRYSHVNCSGHGVCIDGTCTCDALYMGDACDIPVCPNNCSYNRGMCNREKHRCDCEEGNKGRCGSDSVMIAVSWPNWVTGKWSSGKILLPEGSASHGAVVWRDSLYIVGGESYRRAKMIYVYDFNGNVWETPHLDSKNLPRLRYGHSAVLFGDKIYMYGGVEENGVVSNELWAFDVSAKTWENITVHSEQCNNTGTNMSTLCGPLRSAGHTATVVTSTSPKKSEQMIVIFGHSPVYGYLNTVQEYHFGTRKWNVVPTQGFPVKGGYGHSAAWDPLSQRIYVYGGFVSESTSTPVLSNKLYSYDPNTRKWFVWKLKVVVSIWKKIYIQENHTRTGLMIVFGGNTHNDTAHSFGAKCYSSDMLAYDVICDSWSTLPVPRDLRSDLARFGHSANIFENSLYIYGGFDGQMLSDMLRYTPGKCGSFTSQSRCLLTQPGVKCVWNRHESKCYAIGEVPQIVIMPAFDMPEDGSEEEMYSRCPDEGISSSTRMYSELCSGFSDCLSCVHTSFQCEWCGSAGCSYQRCKDMAASPGKEAIPTRPYRSWSGKEESQCEDRKGPVCQQLHNCQACSTHFNCHWDFEQRCKAIGNATEQQEPAACTSSCAEFTSCLNCTVEECIWCQNEGRCVDKNAYTASFPYGQCREWTTHQARCRSTSVMNFGASCIIYYLIISRDQIFYA